ncbi:OmpA family protein [Brumimicrobium mesophilum]|uniref:OmpA family protein n=1 Tax=Brumimicrobium mesophilum TaxID=392717 RepID=UPI000D13F35E|nr:OmpA family protein [Brumimicrobium mesophilum]
MTKNIGLLFTLLLLLFSSCATAQMGYGTKSKKAIKLYEEARNAPQENFNVKTGRPNYQSGIDLLKKALEKDNNFLEAHQLIGEFYRITNQPKESVFHFKKSLSIRPDANLNGQLYVDISEQQFRNGEFEDAILYADKVIMGNNRSTPQHLINISHKIKTNAEFSIFAINNPAKINPVNIGKSINTKYPEYFPTITVDGKTLLFTREVPNNDGSPRGQEDFFFSTLSEDNLWSTAVPMPANINTEQNEGAPTISADGRTLIFVGCPDVTGRNYGRNRVGRGSCDLFVTERIGGQWTNPKNLPGRVNTANWETQPSLSADGKTLYFIRRVNDRERKRSDIFVSEKLPDGSWGAGVPLPDHINTEMSESSVMIHPDGQTLYFASNGHVGMGGTDIYMSRKDPKGNWGNPINLGYPINSESNENSLLVGPDGEIAFFASDRAGGEGDLDIYYFELPKEYQPIKTTYFEGLVFDAQTKEPLKGNFELFDLETGEQIIASEADAITGEFLVALPTQKEYALNVDFPGYSFFSKNFNMIESSDEAIQMEIPMVPLSDEQPVLLANVFFDLGKSSLRKESFVELNKLVSLLNINAAIKIEIGGHTDTRGDKDDNLRLSKERAKSVYDYLVKEGISSSRLTFKGYGEQKPINTDAQIDMLGSEKEKEKAHQENRRTEYRIVK